MVDAAPVLELRNISRAFAGGAILAVDGVDLSVFPSEIVSILGPSGCGKTTLMRMVAGLDSPTSGDVRIFGDSVVGMPPHRRNVGLVFQSLAIFPHMSVRENVAFGLRMKGLAKAAIREKVDALLDLVQLPPRDFAERHPTQLSGGQLQRVALARTLVTEPALVLFDEPMAALDRRLRDYMAVELRGIQRKLGIAAIYVTHDQETASAMSDRIAIMQTGKIVQVGTAEDVYDAPAGKFVADFLGDANFVEPDAVERIRGNVFRAKLGKVEFDIESDIGSPLERPVVMFRPEHADLSITNNGSGGALEGTVANMHFGGGQYHWQVEVPGQAVLTVRSTENAGGNAPVGAKVWVSIKPGRARLLRK